LVHEPVDDHGPMLAPVRVKQNVAPLVSTVARTG
jgi:hypothetical protein